MKEIKNKIEIAGMREAHARDCGAAVTLFPLSVTRPNVVKCDLFGWLEEQVYSGEWVKESDVPIQLTEFQKLSHMGCGVIVDEDHIILARVLKLWRVRLLMPLLWNMLRNQILVHSSTPIQCSC